MNILFFATSNFKPESGGIAELGHQLAQTLSEQGHCITVLAGELKNGRELEDYRYQLLRTGKRNILKTARSIIIKERIDLIFVLVMNSSLSTALFLGGRYKVPVALYVHGLELTKRKGNVLSFWLKQSVKRFLLKRCDLILCNSFNTMLLLLRKGMASSRVRVLHPGVSTKGISVQTQEFWEDPAPGKIVFLTLGRVVKRKGIDQAIRAVAHLKDECPELLYVVAGGIHDSYRLELETLIQDLEGSSHVKLLGAISETEKNKWYMRHDVFLMPSRQLKDGDVEGFGIVFLEAALHGKPTIGGDSGGIPDAIVDGRTGLLVDPESPDSIAAAMRRLIKDPSYRKRLGEEGRKRAVALFNWVRQAQKFISFISFKEQRTIAQFLGKGDKYFNELDSLPLQNPIDIPAAMENLVILKEVFDWHAIPFFLFFGTLLGAIREKDFIKYDTDTDICTFEAYRWEFLEALPELENKGLRLVKTAKEDRVVTLYRNGAYIDLYFVQERRIGFRKKWYIDYSSVARESLLHFRKILFRGIEVLVPEKSEKLLTELYGKNWNVPKQGYEAKHDLRMKLSRFLKKKNKMSSVVRFIHFMRRRLFP